MVVGGWWLAVGGWWLVVDGWLVGWLLLLLVVVVGGVEYRCTVWCTVIIIIISVLS